jgi:hypothetical protein
MHQVCSRGILCSCEQQCNWQMVTLGTVYDDVVECDASARWGVQKDGMLLGVKGMGRGCSLAKCGSDDRGLRRKHGIVQR